jgi:hypothetical protein
MPTSFKENIDLGILCTVTKFRRIGERQLLDVIPKNVIEIVKAKPDPADYKELLSDERMRERLEKLERRGWVGVRHEAHSNFNLYYPTEEGLRELEKDEVKAEIVEGALTAAQI